MHIHPPPTLISLSVTLSIFRPYFCCSVSSLLLSSSLSVCPLSILLLMYPVVVSWCVCVTLSAVYFYFHYFVALVLLSSSLSVRYHLCCLCILSFPSLPVNLSSVYFYFRCSALAIFQSVYPQSFLLLMHLVAVSISVCQSIRCLFLLPLFHFHFPMSVIYVFYYGFLVSLAAVFRCPFIPFPRYCLLPVSLSTCPFPVCSPPYKSHYYHFPVK